MQFQLLEKEVAELSVGNVGNISVWKGRVCNLVHPKLH